MPALYEGGPICVVEALACGTAVIAPPVGWVPTYPRTEYPIGDIAELSRVLLEKIDQKNGCVPLRCTGPRITGRSGMMRYSAGSWMRTESLLPPPAVEGAEADRIRG
jgi:hypothetical protein